MTGFSAEWLALREPVDHASVNWQVRSALIARLRGRDRLRVVDLGCGTGSNFRSLAPHLGEAQEWLLVDHDAALLAHAKDAAASGGPETASTPISTQRADLSSGDIAGVISAADLVTAAALFDLISVLVIDRMVDHIVDQGAVFYTTLTYDGIASWIPEHAGDAAMREAFNTHQRRDKGFGPAAGPAATDALAQAFLARGYAVQRGKSPWVLDNSHRDLRLQVDRGWVQAATETELVPRETTDAWLAMRSSEQHEVTIVGHEDLLATPVAS